MFDKTIITSDDFLDMPATARCLYFTLNMYADDDGFVNNPKSIMRQTNSSTDDMNILALKKYVIPFETGVIVITHWKIHNYIKADRYKETDCKAEKAQLRYGQNGEYTKDVEISTMSPKCLQNGYTGKSKSKDSSSAFTPPTKEEVRAYFKEKGFVIDPDYFFDYYDSDNWLKGNSRNNKKEPMHNWKQTAIQWNKRQLERNPQQKPQPKKKSQEEIDREMKIFAELRRKEREAFIEQNNHQR